MTDNAERAISRLENIKAIEPLLSALRTISMGTWQSALKRINQISNYEEALFDILYEILPKLDKIHRTKNKANTLSMTDTVILLVGTERGLCSKFNKSLIEKSINWINSHHLSSYQIWAIGQRMTQNLKKLQTNISWQKSLPSGNLLDYKDALSLTNDFLSQYESFAFNRLVIMFNQLTKGNQTEFSTLTLLPYELHIPVSKVNGDQDVWPPSIIETLPEGIYHQIIQHSLAASFYRILLQSAAAEHSTRFNIMEEAKDNADDIIVELNQVINTERKKKITSEMQELATGSGLLEKE